MRHDADGVVRVVHGDAQAALADGFEAFARRVEGAGGALDHVHRSAHEHAATAIVAGERYFVVFRRGGAEVSRAVAEPRRLTGGL